MRKGGTHLAVVRVEDRVGHVVGRPHEVGGETHVSGFCGVVQRLLSNAEAFQLCNNTTGTKFARTGTEGGGMRARTRYEVFYNHAQDMKIPHARGNAREYILP